MNKAIEHYYRQARAHQQQCAGCLTTYPSGRTEQTYGSACYGEHAYAALMSARGSIRLRKDLKARIRQDKKRSAAARKGWKTRRAAQLCVS